MKKVIIGLSGLVVLAVAIILFTNARATSQEVKKAVTEISKDCSKCPSAATCTKATATSSDKKAVTCDMEKCKAAGCDMTKCKEGKCDPATCKVHATAAKSEMKSCPAECPMKTKAQ